MDPNNRDDGFRIIEYVDNCEVPPGMKIGRCESSSVSAFFEFVDSATDGDNPQNDQGEPPEPTEP